MYKPKVLLLTYGNRDHASTRIRVLNHFSRLTDFYDTTWIPRIGLHHRKDFPEKFTFALLKIYYFIKREFFLLFFKYDFVFVQTIFLPERLLKSLKKKGSYIYYDFDDAIYTYSQSSFNRMINYSDKIIISTPFLKDDFDSAHKSHEVIFSPVDTESISPTIPSDQAPLFTIGWIGSPWTLLHLESIKDALIELSLKIRFKLLIVGANMAIDGLEIECLEWSEETELNALKKMHIGIMPLDNHEWSPKKGGYKLYLYMAAGLPVVGTPIGINKLIINNLKNGFWADTKSDWIDSLYKLYIDSTLRNEMGLAARKDAVQLYSYTACTPKLHAFLEH